MGIESRNDGPVCGTITEPTRFDRLGLPSWWCCCFFVVYAVSWQVGRRIPQLLPFEQADPERPHKTRPMGNSVLFSLLFSVDTFVPFTIVTGVKDWAWRITDRFRWVELTERVMRALIGAFAAYTYLL